MQEELLQFKIQNVWILVDCPEGVRPIGTKWEEGIDYEKVFAPVARIEAIRLFLAYASFMGFTVYQMDVKSVFLYGGEGNVWTSLGSESLKKDGIFLSQDKYVGDILKKFGYSDVRSANTPMDKENPWGKDETGKDVDLHLYRSMIGSLMYLTASRPDIMFVVCVCARHQVTPKECHLHAVKRIFRYLKVIMARLAFCDYHNMIAILEKYEHNVYFHQIVDFVKASYIRIETMDAETKILATVDGKPKTISESSIKRNLKLNNEAGISSLPDAELFKNLALMGYNILPNQKFTFQKDESASLLRYDSQGEAFPTVYGLEAGQDRENIIKTSALPHDSPPRVTSLAADEDNKDRGCAEPSGEDATIKGRSLEKGEEVGVAKSTERGSNDTEELVNVLTSLDAANILTSRVQVVSVPPAAKVSTVGIPTGSGLVPTASPIFTTVSVVTPYSRRKGKEKTVESDTPKKKKLQEQIDVARDDEIARIHAEEEQQMLIDGLDRNNEVIARHLHEYEQAAAELTIGEKIKLINELVKYQDHHAKILKYQAQQSKPLSKKQQREFYISVLKTHSRWKTQHFKASKEEGERMKRKRLRLEQESAKQMKTSEEVSEEDLKEMMQLVPVEEVYVEALQVKHPIIDWEIHTEDILKHFNREDLIQLWTLVKETLSIRHATSDKEKELWVELKRLFKLYVDNQLWTHTQALMHDPLEWRLYDTCGVHHGRIVGHKMLKSFPLLVIKMPLLEEFPTAREEMFPLLSQRDAPAEEVCIAKELKERQLLKHRVQDSLSYKRSPYVIVNVQISVS
nr:hypothetical protein [Tanacetum cinerariifolium]